MSTETSLPRRAESRYHSCPLSVQWRFTSNPTDDSLERPACGGNTAARDLGSARVTAWRDIGPMPGGYPGKQKG